MAGSFALAFFVGYLPFIFIRKLMSLHFLKWLAFVVPLLLVASVYHAFLDGVSYLDVFFMEIMATGGGVG
jgi:hypothetical protein